MTAGVVGGGSVRLVDSPRAKAAVVAAGAGVVGVLVVASLAIGSVPIPLATTIEAIVDFDPEEEHHLIIRDLRWPRTVFGLLAGMAFGLGGAVMQGVSRNPLADPGILGINAGAALLTVVAITYLGLTTVNGYVWFSFAGALIAAVVVYGIGSLGREGATPVKITLAGAAISVLLGSLTSAVVLTDIDLRLQLQRWSVGSLSGRPVDLAVDLAPFLVVGALLALACGPALNALALGDDLARGLGQRVGLARAAGALSVVLLVGAATAAVGPVGFVGLIIPHIGRAILGPDYRWILLFSVVMSPALLLGSDIVGRVVLSPAELQVGFVTIGIGAPFFVWLVQRRDLAEL